MDLQVDLNGLKLSNPVMTASGTFGYAAEYKDLVDLNGLGAIIVKGLSLNPSTGNPEPRVVETPCGMLNAVGLENVGLKAFVDAKLPFLCTLKPPVLVNIYGKTMEDYETLASELNRISGNAGVEVNITCPNVPCQCDRLPFRSCHKTRGPSNGMAGCRERRGPRGGCRGDHDGNRRPGVPHGRSFSRTGRDGESDGHRYPGLGHPGA